VLVPVAGAAAGILLRALRGSPRGRGFFDERTARQCFALCLPAYLAALVGVMALIVSRRSRS
jgi:hypothetical protein